MLPKVATHLLHSTTRSAAAAVHGQSSTLRNVLQSGPTSAAGATGTGSKPKSGSAPSKPTPTTTAANAVKPVTIALVSASGSSLTSAAAAASSSASSSSSTSQQTHHHHHHHNYRTDSASHSNPHPNPNSNADEFFSSNSHAGANSQGRAGSGSKGSAKNGNGNNNPKAGRRFYTNYNSASRAVTQANTIIVTEDVAGFQSSTSDDASSSLSLHPSTTTESRRALLKASAKSSASKSSSPASELTSGARGTTRLRSSSVNSLLPRSEKDKEGGAAVMEKISVLKTVQLQARSLHVLSAAAASKAVAATTTPSSSLSSSATTATAATRDDIVLSNTTSSDAATAPQPLVVSSSSDSSDSQTTSTPAVVVEEEVVVQVEVAAAPAPVDSSATTAAVSSVGGAAQQSPVVPSPTPTVRSRSPSPTPLAPCSRAASPLPRPRSPIRRRNSTSSVRSMSRPASPAGLLFVEDPSARVEVQVHLEPALGRRRSSSVADVGEAKDVKSAPVSPVEAATTTTTTTTPASPSMSSTSETSEARSTSTGATSVGEPEAGARSPEKERSNKKVLAKQIKKMQKAQQGGRSPALSSHGQKVAKALDQKDAFLVADAVRSLLQVASDPHAQLSLTSADFNAAISALLQTRHEGETLGTIMEVYHVMLGMSEVKGSRVRPNLRTYGVLIDALTIRDWEIHRMLLALTSKVRGAEVRRSAAGFGGQQLPEQQQEESADEEKIRVLTEESESGFKNALKLFEAVAEVGGREYVDMPVYKALLRSCASHGNVKAALIVFGQLERRTGSVSTGNEWWSAAFKAKEGKEDAPVNPGPDAESYRYLIQAFTNCGDYQAAELVFEKFKQKWVEGKVYMGAVDEKEGLQATMLNSYTRLQVQVWNQMVEMYFRSGQPEKAVDVLDEMLKASASGAEEQAKIQEAEGGEGKGGAGREAHAIPPVVPAPASSTFTTIIGGFIKMGDVSTAYLWFKRLLEESDSPNEDPFVGAVGGRAMKPDQVGWTLMLDALASAGRVEDLNEIFGRLVAGTAKNGVKASLAVLQEPMSLEGVRVFRSYRNLVYLANMEWMKDAPVSTPAEMETVLRRLDFVKDTVVTPRLSRKVSTASLAVLNEWDSDRRQMVEGLCGMYVRLGAFEQGYELLGGFVNDWLATLDGLQGQPWNTQEVTSAIVAELQNMSLGFWEKSLEVLRRAPGEEEWPWKVAIGLALLNTQMLGLKVTPEQAVWLLHAYGRAVETMQPAVAVEYVPPKVFGVLLGCAIHVDTVVASNGPGLLQESGIGHFAFKGTPSVLQDIARKGFAFDDSLADVQTRLEAVEIATRGRDVAWGRDFLSKLGETYLEAYEQLVRMRYEALKEHLEEVVPAPPSAVHVQPQERVDMEALPPLADYGRLEQHASLSRDVDVSLKNISLSQQERAERAYSTFQQNLESKKIVPHVPTLGRLIQACGRLGQLDRVREVYHVSQVVITNLRNNMGEARRRDLWVNVEDSMIIALAHAGDVEGAHVHRRRILEYGGYSELPAGTNGGAIAAPSADAYGALILYVKDTTDDASNSLMLWNEAMRVGVTPNLYLFNNIISKLSRARKADYALELFHTMKDQGIVPSSITYGAVIGACARVGDVVSAETLFREMVEQSNFKPRVPPFNTMMQVYTTTKPNRERALWYYEEMKKMGVHPTSHTYKLLLDLYGSVEPLDIVSMENVFEQLKQDRRVQLQGTHFASLINAYGCVLKDLDKAITTFDSIPSYMSDGKLLVPDAVVYEAIVNALVANRRTDLISNFMERMAQDQVHMTAYVANFLIKGYANVGDIEQARNIFEGMRDPPTGVAAPNNHAPHDLSGVSGSVDVMDPVYREPSTWEAMIRAELGSGNRDRAYELLERLKVRQYPEAVFNRISGVMVDHSAVVLP